MAEGVITDDIVATYDALNRALAQLEKAGEFAAAAHVAAALDVIELKIDQTHRLADKAAPSDAVAMIVKRMGEAFGDSAETVARRQLVGACGAPLVAWAAIVNRMCL